MTDPTIHRLRRDSVEIQLNLGKILEHLGLPPVTEAEIDAAMVEEETQAGRAWTQRHPGDVRSDPIPCDRGWTNPYHHGEHRCVRPFHGDDWHWCSCGAHPPDARPPRLTPVDPAEAIAAAMEPWPNPPQRP